ncbi:hypothetical protein I8748_00270 [Nostoc sp. CENA67]|uniref:Uncharacterized protein n=1 Tax=Amazonocrinis nigriterrae CENA67 TaxID=2794033 RepID=A0A8J7HNI9_9NOST|nr:hypothetical protein [Amazonocrinis nigriterrae]MBH8560658.1 hypothetical protein [Amazonocrinis nigriterrae CENA67]
MTIWDGNLTVEGAECGIHSWNRNYHVQQLIINLRSHDYFFRRSHFFGLP